MPKNINITTDINQLQSIPKPNNSNIIEHKDIANLVIDELVTKGFEIQSQEYRISVNLEVVQGVLHLNNKDSSVSEERGLMLTWINGYDKATGFRVEMGASNIEEIETGAEFFIEFDNKTFRRNSIDLVNHTKQYVQERIDQGLNNFTKFIAVREKFKQSIVSQEDYESMMGTFFFKDIITSSQLINLKNNFNLPSPCNVWNVWCEITKTFKSCHPKAWFKQQSSLSDLLMIKYITVSPPVDPAQTDLVSMIEESLTDLDIEKNVETEELEKTEEPKVLSLADYDLSTKKTTNIIVEDIVEDIVEEPEVVEEPENETSLLKLDDYEASDFPIAPEELPVWVDDIVEIVESNIEHTERVPVIEEDEDWSIMKAKEVEYPQQIEEATEEDAAEMLYGVDNSGGLTTLEIKPAFASEVNVETLVDNIESTDEADENLQDALDKAAEEGSGEFIEYPEITDEEAQYELEALQESNVLNAKEDLNSSIKGNDWDIDKAEIAVSLENQVASSEIQPVSEDELIISKKPVINEPSNNSSVTQNSNSNEATLESPNFEF
tara:strand:- start:1377 stop:3029 length:1653 start_codon:yes stop_codon:yes gene_type:complete